MKPVWIHLIPLFLFILPAFACAPWQKVDPPGVGAAAERGYAACNPVIEALERYHEANGRYPDSLGELVPEFIASVPADGNDHPIDYTRTDAGFILSFDYTGPGMNTCLYDPSDGRGWRCSGAY